MMSPRLNQGDKLAHQLLFGNTWAPLTNTIGFINAPLDEAASIWRNWDETRPHDARTSVSLTGIEGTLSELLTSLVPLGTGNRKLFLETSDPQWTAVLDNSANGADLSSGLKVQYAQQRGIRTVSVKEVPHTLDKKSYVQHRGRYGIRELMVWGPGDFVRGIGLVNEDRWVFWSGGEPLAFENASAYESPRKQDRFTHEMLVTYCQNLGLDPFNEDFYAPNGKGIVVETHVKQTLLKLSLDEARAGYEDRDVPSSV
ncbi:UNVERIFIED_CONTAM: organic radical activating enzyme [Jeotgalibacillus campisalis]